MNITANSVRQTSALSVYWVHRSRLAAATLTMLLTLNACNNAHVDDSKPTVADQRAETTKATEFGAWGVDTKSMSKDIQPGDDFYRYVNKGWLDTAKIPEGLTAIESFTAL